MEYDTHNTSPLDNRHGSETSRSLTRAHPGRASPSEVLSGGRNDWRSRCLTCEPHEAWIQFLSPSAVSATECLRIRHTWDDMGNAGMGVSKNVRVEIRRSAQWGPRWKGDKPW